MRGLTRGRPVGFLLVIVAALLPASCGRSDPADGVAVRMAGATTEVIFVGCSPVAVDSVAVVAATDPGEFRTSDPPVWKLSFPKPRPTAGTFIVGQTPDRAILDVPLASSLDGGKAYIAVMYLDGGELIHEAFQLDKLGGRIAYNNGYLSADDFADATACATPAPGY